MKIRLAIVENDEEYAEKLIGALINKYSDKIEVSRFTDLDAAVNALSDLNIDVLLAVPNLVDSLTTIPKRCGFGYLVSGSGVSKYEGQPAVCKYQKTELLYKQILDIYAESSKSVVRPEPVHGETRLILFSSPCGGTGTSSAAAGCSIRFAAEGRKTLYFNLEQFGSSNPFFSSDGQFGLSDLIFALKRKNSNISMKLESCVRKSAENVYFYAPVTVAPERFELTASEIRVLLETLQTTGEYHDIIVDMDFRVEKEFLQNWDLFSSVIWVLDGSSIAHEKALRALEYLTVGNEHRFLDRIQILFNKCEPGSQNQIGLDNLKILGTLPNLNHSVSSQIAIGLSMNKLFDSI